MKKIKQPQVSYDPDAKILSIRLSSLRSVDSDAKGNVVLDYDAKGNLVNVDIMKVSLNEFGRTPTFSGLIKQARVAHAA